MSARMQHFISPKYLPDILARYQTIVATLCILFFSYGLFAGLVLAPRDFQQGNVYRIMYIHVPLAIQSLSVYTIMSVCAFIYLIWKIKIFDWIAKASAPIGAVFTTLTLITGSLWGKPTWGTFWIWDARLTSELILLFVYFAVIAIRKSIPESRLSSHATAMVILLGFVNIPIIHYSVQWWNTLHQGPSILQLSKPTIAPEMLHPLFAMIVGMYCYYVLLLIKNMPQKQ